MSIKDNPSVGTGTAEAEAEAEAAFGTMGPPTGTGETQVSQGSPDSPLAGPIRPTLHRRASRSIDEFYSCAYDNFRWAGPLSVVSFLSNRLPYLLCHCALGLATFGNAATLTCMANLFAGNTGFENVGKGKEGLIACSFHVGAALGGLLAGPLSDLLGRRKILLSGLSASSGFGILIAFVASPWSLMFCRLMSGLGVGASMPCVSSLVAEHSSSNSRGFYSNLIDSQWTVGFIYSSFLALVFLSGGGERGDWSKLYFLCIAAPQAAALVLVHFYVPESSPYLALHGQYEKATRVANRVARSMSFDGESLHEEEVMEQYPQTSIQELPPCVMASFSASFASFQALYSDRALCREVLVAQALWFLLNMGYGVAHWVSRLYQELEFVDNAFLGALVFTLGAVPGLFLAGIAIEKVGRQVFLRFSLFATLFSVCLFTVLAFLSRNAVGIVAASALFHSCLITCWSSISLVTTEAFDTSRRSAVLGVCTASGMLGLAAMNLFSTFLLKQNKPIVLLLLGTASLMLAAVATYTGFLQVKERGVELRDIPNKLGTSPKFGLRSSQRTVLSFGSTGDPSEVHPETQNQALEENMGMPSLDHTGDIKLCSAQTCNNSKLHLPLFPSSSEWEMEIEV